MSDQPAKRTGGKKGPAWEREVCKILSRWWTKDFIEPFDSVFWRTAGSGARATTRGKKGKLTKYQHGDVTFIDPIGEPFIRSFTIELKRGYSTSTIMDIVDKHNQRSVYAEWIAKLAEQSYQQGSYSWLLITRRDQRVPMVFMPEDKLLFLINKPQYVGTFGSPVIRVRCLINDKPHEIIGITLEEWTREVAPRRVRIVANRDKRPWLLYDRLSPDHDPVMELKDNGHYATPIEEFSEAYQKVDQIIR